MNTARKSSMLAVGGTRGSKLGVGGLVASGRRCARVHGQSGAGPLEVAAGPLVMAVVLVVSAARAVAAAELGRLTLGAVPTRRGSRCTGQAVV